MANLKASKIDIRKSRKREIANRRVRSNIKTFGKKLETSIEAKAEDTVDAGSRYVSVLDRAVKRNVIHKNKASRLKSRTAKLINSATS